MVPLFSIDPVSIEEIYLKMIFNKDKNYVNSEEFLSEYMKLGCYLILKSMRSMREEINISIKGKQSIVESKSTKKVGKSSLENLLSPEPKNPYNPWAKMSKQTLNKIFQNNEKMDDFNRDIEDAIKLFSHNTNIQLQDYAYLVGRYIGLIKSLDKLRGNEDKEENLEKFTNEQIQLLHYK
uniref:Uncharacterized protein n=1 Tax=Meloidogyne floridensis TaxID=298350 RepID=A0A915NFR5_9BILA